MGSTRLTTSVRWTAEAGAGTEGAAVPVTHRVAGIDAVRWVASGRGRALFCQGGTSVVTSPLAGRSPARG
jgi:hypothetical protein